MPTAAAHRLPRVHTATHIRAQPSYRRGSTGGTRTAIRILLFPSSMDHHHAKVRIVPATGKALPHPAPGTRIRGRAHGSWHAAARNAVVAQHCGGRVAACMQERTGQHACRHATTPLSPPAHGTGAQLSSWHRPTRQHACHLTGGQVHIRTGAQAHGSIGRHVHRRAHAVDNAHGGCHTHHDA